MKFTITIDCHDSGKIDIWTQKKDQLTPKEVKTFERLKKKIKNAVESEAEIERIVEA